MIAAGQGVIMGGLLARLGYLQLIEGEQYQTLADRNRIDVRTIPPSRGLIYDRAGTVLAGNEQNFRLLITPEQVKDMDDLLNRLSEFIEIDAIERQYFLDRVKELPKFVSIELKDGLDWETVTKIEVRSNKFPGVKISTGEQRLYPKGNDTAHIVGYVSAISKVDIKNDPSLIRLPDLKIGKTGIEGAFEELLRGEPGAKKIEVNVAGREIRELEQVPSKPGQSAILSIDASLQNFVNERLALHKSASCVVMNCDTGDIYALGSHPSFDPNLFIRGLSPEKWQELLSDKTYPLSNKAISGLYPPGSTFKMVTALAGLEAGLVTAKSQVFCPGHFDLGTDRFRCWKKAGHGAMDMVEALAQSCDVYFYDLAAKLGIDKIAAMARRFGLGTKLGFDLPEERGGLVPDERWKLGHIGTKWQKGESVVAAIGQGYLQTTPLQLAVMCARMVNGGYGVNPWLVTNTHRDIIDKKSFEKLEVDPYHLTLVMRGMNRAVNAAKGTALGSRIASSEGGMGGKTGTAQVRRITQKQRELGVQQEELPWRQRHHALFVGYAPVEKPKYVCSTVIEHGIGGSRTAAPLTRDVLRQVLKMDLANKERFSLG